MWNQCALFVFQDDDDGHLLALQIIRDLVDKGGDVFLDQLARLGVINKVSTLAGPASDDENEDESKPEKVKKRCEVVGLQPSALCKQKKHSQVGMCGAAGGGGAGGCQGDPAGEAIPLEGLVHHQREGLPLHLVRRCCPGALQWLQRMVQVYPGWKVGHHVLQREPRRRIRQLRLLQLLQLFSRLLADLRKAHPLFSTLVYLLLLYLQSLAASSWRSFSERGAR